jgi:hypothetical protein
MPPALFALVYFSDMVSLFGGGVWGQPVTYTCCIAGIIGMNHCAQFVFEIGVSLSFCPGCPLAVNCDLRLISTSCGAGIIDVSHSAGLFSLL